MKQPHLLCTDQEIAPNVLLPGDPARVLRVAEFLDSWREIAYNREFRTITGQYGGVPVTVTSTGIGGASAAIAVEELIACGASVFVRIGSAGATQPQVALGDLIIAEGAVREDGASRMYLPKEYPAVADPEMVVLMQQVCREKGFPHHTGIVRSHDSFYVDEEEMLLERWHQKGVLGSDMETAALLVVARLRNKRAASILNNVVLFRGDLREGIVSYVDEQAAAAEGEKREIIVALETIKKMQISD